MRNYRLLLSLHVEPPESVAAEDKDLGLHQINSEAGGLFLRAGAEKAWQVLTGTGAK